MAHLQYMWKIYVINIYKNFILKLTKSLVKMVKVKVKSSCVLSSNTIIILFYSKKWKDKNILIF